MLNGGPVTWFSVLGKTIAMSTCEADVNAAVVAAKDAVHIQRLLVDLGVCDGINHFRLLRIRLLVLPRPKLVCGMFGTRSIMKFVFASCSS